MKRSPIGNKLVLCFATASLAIGGAASYNITLFQPTTINGKELKEGDYKLELNDHTAVIRQGKTAVEADVKPETVDRKYASTSVKYVVTNGKNNVQEIRLGGTKTKLVFETGRTASGGI